MEKGLLPSQNPNEWNFDDVGGYLQSIGFGKWIKAFVSQEIDGTTLLSLTDEDMKELKLTIGERKRLQNELDKLRGVTSKAGHHVPQNTVPSTRVATSYGTAIGSSLDSGESIMEMQFDHKNYPKTFMVSLPLLSYGLTLPFLPIFYFLSRAYVRSQKVRLTSTRMIIEKGICNIDKRSIPLDKIQDIDIMHGCVDRCFGQCKVAVSTGGSDLTGRVLLLGPTNVDEFRQAFLDARNHMVLQRMNGAVGPSS